MRSIGAVLSLFSEKKSDWNLETLNFTLLSLLNSCIVLRQLLTDFSISRHLRPCPQKNRCAWKAYEYSSVLLSTKEWIGLRIEEIRSLVNMRNRVDQRTEL